MDKNFYEELKLNIEKLIKEEKYSEALKLIEEEKSMPYSPREIETFLAEKYDEISRKIYSEEKAINADKVLDLLGEDLDSVNKYDLAMSLEQFNLKKYVDEIQKLLLKDESVLEYEVKKLIMSKLLEQDIKRKYKYLKNHQEYEIDLSSFTPIQDDKDFIELSSKIEKLLFKIPAALNVALNILEQTFLSMLFDQEDVDMRDAEYYTALYALQMLGDEKEYETLLEMAPESVKNILANK